VLVPNGGSEALARALKHDFTGFDPQVIRAHAHRFSRRAFQERLLEIVDGTPPRRRRTAVRAAVG
jgi:hypothetical protein